MAIFWGSSGKTYTLGNTPLATGGEGNIFVVQSEANRVAKIYHSVTSSLEKKITLMMKRPPSPSITNQLAWPLDVLRDQNGQFKGFVMRKLNITNELHELYKYPPMEYEGVTLSHKLVIAENICAVISGVHKAGYIFGDFNPMNIGVNLKDGTVAFFDTDTYHIRDPYTNETYRCNVAYPGYVAPELIAACKSYKITNPAEKDVYAHMPLPTFTEQTDNFALAIHIFKLLMNGYSPFNGIGSKLTVSQASPGIGDVAVERDNYCFKPGLKPQSVATPPLATLPKTIQDHFNRAFVQGRTSPSLRPSADEWRTALEQYENSLTQCKADVNHRYYKMNSNCPWCEAKKRYEHEMSLVTGISNVPRAGISNPIVVPPAASTSSYTVPSAAATVSSNVIQPQTTWQKQEVFWTITLVLAAIIAGLCMYIGGYSVFGSESTGNNMISGIGDFFDVIAPYLLFAGGLGGTIFYNVKFASKNRNCYTSKDYILSVLSCPAAVLVTVVAIVILAFVIYIFIVILIIGIIISALSGG